MKKIFFIPLILICFYANSQAPPYTRINFGYSWYGGYFDRLHVPSFNTTPSLRSGQWTGAGAVGIDSLLHRFYFYSGGSWRRLALYSEISSGQVDSLRRLSGSLSVDARKGGVWVPQFTDSTSGGGACLGLQSGGQIVWDSLLVFTVSAADYCIDDIGYKSSLTHVTLDAADSDPRIDVFVLTTSGTVTVVKGTAAPDPAKPYIAPDQLEIGFVTIGGGATEPAMVQTIIYDENTEWTGSTTSVSVNFNDATSPYHLAKDASAGAVTASSVVKWTAPSAFKISQYNVLRFFVKLKATFATGCRFQITWLNGTSTVSTAINITSGTYGFTRSSATYQEIVVPLSDFTFTKDSVDAIKFQLTGSNASGFYMDWVQIQGGLQQTLQKGQRFGVSGEDAVATQDRSFNGKGIHFFNMDSIASLSFGFNPGGGFRLKDYTTALPNNDILKYISSGFYVDPLSRPLYFNNIPASDTASYVLGITTGGRAILQNKSAIVGSAPNLQAVTDAGNVTTDSVWFNNHTGDSLYLMPTRIEGFNGFGGSFLVSPGYIYAQNGLGVRWLAGNEVGMSNAGSGFNTSIKNINPSATNEFYLHETNTSSHVDTLATLEDVRVISASDIRLKDIEGNYSLGIESIKKINPILFRWKNKSGINIGFSAQNVQSVLGEGSVTADNRGYLLLNDRALIATLVNAIKEQQNEIDELKREVNNLKLK